MARSTIQVDVDIGDFEDDALVQEVIDRKLAGEVLAQSKSGPEQISYEMRQQVCSAMGNLMVNRMDKAKSELKAIIKSLVPVHIVEALEAIDEGRVDDAINDLDRCIDPAPAATAIKLPEKVW